MDETEAKEFEQRCKYLKALGVVFHQEEEWRPALPPRDPHPLRIFKSVKLPFTAHEWVALCQTEGQFYLGGCCGNMSALQDDVEHIFRIDSGWFEVRKLAEIAETMMHHDGCGDGEDVSSFAKLPKKESLDKAVKRWKHSLKLLRKARKEGRKVIQVWEFLALVWHIVKDFYAPERPRPEAHHVNDKRSELDDAVSLLSRALMAIAWDKLFDRSNDQPDPAAEAQSQANRLVTLARLLPALKILNQHIDQLAPPPIDGVALVLKEAPEVVLSNGHGLCVFSSEADAEKLIKLWVKQENEFEIEGQGPKDKADRFAIRRVRVTTSKGVEFMEAT